MFKFSALNQHVNSIHVEMHAFAKLNIFKFIYIIMLFKTLSSFSTIGTLKTNVNMFKHDITI